MIYDLTRPQEAIQAFEICAAAHNQRKFVCLSSFMTWARTELPPPVEEENNEPNEDELPDEKTMEPQEVVDLYKKAKQPVPQWVLEKIEEIKRAEKAQREADGIPEEVPEEKPAEDKPAEEKPADEKPEGGEEKVEEEKEEELEEEEVKVDPEELLLKLSTFGF